MHFRDRRDAGRLLARRLARFAQRPGLIVLALPRGGVPVADEVARSLGAPLDIFFVRKLGAPGQPELAMGAIASGGTRVLNQHVLGLLGADAGRALEEATVRETAELRLREAKYRGNRPFPELRGRAVVLVDDGLATGATMRAAAQAVRSHEPKELILAVPVAPAETCRTLENEADEVICAFTPEGFFGVGQFYENFSQTTDEEVRRCLLA